MPYPCDFCVVLIPRGKPQQRIYVEATAATWTLAVEQAQHMHPDDRVESVYQLRVSVAGKCLRCGEWQQDAFAVQSRRVCADCS